MEKMANYRIYFDEVFATDIKDKSGIPKKDFRKRHSLNVDLLKSMRYSFIKKEMVVGLLEKDGILVETTLRLFFIIPWLLKLLNISGLWRTIFDCA